MGICGYQTRNPFNSKQPNSLRTINYGAMSRALLEDEKGCWRWCCRTGEEAGAGCHRSRRGAAVGVVSKDLREREGRDDWKEAAKSAGREEVLEDPSSAKEDGVGLEGGAETRAWRLKRKAGVWG
ncbi:uncharacterized protein A4U43_C08F17340 [Asparagus officinalis]|nr:uncharacterized protein A4U43_C08F17340 [Asparagus officinalis]